MHFSPPRAVEPMHIHTNIRNRKKFLSTWPGLTKQLVQKFLQKSEATVKGHIRQSYKGKQSTHPKEPNETTSKNPTCTHSAFLQATDLSGKFYTDQTGQFPVTSSHGFKYVMVAYDHDSNTIHAESMNNRSGPELLKSYTAIHNLLSERGLAPKMHYLETECPTFLQKFMTEKDKCFQLVPPHLHRINSAERAIQTFKNNFIAGLVSVNKNFPVHIWCRLLPHCLLTLNLLRPSQINPKLSAYAQLHGAFDFNCTPLASPGTKIIIHDKPVIIGSWATRGYEGWYIGPASNHYRYHTVYENHTAHEQVADTVKFFPHYGKIPHIHPDKIGRAS